ncbi:single-stranded DNA-binding protein [Arthrobacter bambusae]
MNTDQERSALTPRRYDPDRDWFGLDVNPSGTINVPLLDPYLVEPDPAAPWYDTEQDTPETETTLNPILRKVHIMAGETTITVIGNLTSDPELRFTPSGSAVANFTIASTPRTFDRQSNEWKDGETLFLRASVWREAAENVAESLTKGTRVIVSGRLKSRSYETKEGEKRTVIELEVDEIGPSLRYANAKVNRTQRSTAQGAAAGGFGNQGSAQASPQEDPWASQQASGGAGFWGSGPDSEPPF